jgi:hypothetical protein
VKEMNRLNPTFRFTSKSHLLILERQIQKSNCPALSPQAARQNHQHSLVLKDRLQWFGHLELLHDFGDRNQRNLQFFLQVELAQHFLLFLSSLHQSSKRPSFLLLLLFLEIMYPSLLA